MTALTANSLEEPTITLKVRYSWRVKAFYGLLGINNLFWGILASISGSWSDWIGFGFLLLGGICLAAAVWVRYTPYFYFHAETLIQPGWRTKRIPLHNLSSVRSFAGDLILESGSTRITLNKYTARKDDLKALREFLEHKTRTPDTQLDWGG